MSTGFVLFRLAGQTLATSLDDVREIVRLEGLEPLPGTKPPLAGMIVLRGGPLPVLDMRPGAGTAPDGDVLVMASEGDPVGVAVDTVVAVLHPDQLVDAQPAGRCLPDYVTEVRRYDGKPVLVVDLAQLVGATCVDHRGAWEGIPEAVG
jgi:chemotaxis signal transduction protein